MNESESHLIEAYLDGNLTPEQGDALPQRGIYVKYLCQVEDPYW